MEMMSTKGRKDCELCLNHGLKTHFSAEHQLNCPFIECKCDKCSDSLVINEDNQIVLRELNSIMKTVNKTNQISNNTKQIVEKSSQTDFPARDPLEAVKTFADNLSNTNISDNDLRTCVLYALLKNNDFSIEDTRRKLLESRTAITESLVLPLKTRNHLNTNHSCKRSFTSNGDSSVPQKKLFSESTAKKSFPKSSPISKVDSNSKISRTQVIHVSNTSGLYRNANYFSMICQKI